MIRQYKSEFGSARFWTSLCLLAASVALPHASVAAPPGYEVTGFGPYGMASATLNVECSFRETRVGWGATQAEARADANNTVRSCLQSNDPVADIQPYTYTLNGLESHNGRPNDSSHFWYDRSGGSSGAVVVGGPNEAYPGNYQFKAFTWHGPVLKCEDGSNPETSKPLEQQCPDPVVPCAIGSERDAATGECVPVHDVTAEKNLGITRACGASQVGNPVDTAVGNKVAVEVDYGGVGPDPIIFTRYYNSDPRVRAGSLGAKWRHSYDRELVVDGSVATLYRPDGSVVGFSSSGGVWSPDAGYQAQLIAAGNGFEVTLPDGTVEVFDGQGLLRSITDVAGNVQSISRDSSGRITRVTNGFGDLVTLNHDVSGLATFSDRAGRTWSYNYDADGLLTQVTQPDGASRSYQYKTVGEWSGLLSAIVDERGVQIATYDYHDNAAASLTTHINDVGRREITYNEDGTRIVTDSLGRVKTYNTTKSLGEILPAQVTR